MIKNFNRIWKKVFLWVFVIFLVFIGLIQNLGDLIGAKERILREWREMTISDHFREEPESGKARILVADVRHDENGRYTAEIREMLRRDGKRYLMLGREYSVEDEEGHWEDLAKLLERYKSILLLEGAVSANGKTIRIRMRNRDGTIDKRADIELNGSSSWTEKLSYVIVEGTQELVDNVRVERFTTEDYEELAETVRDALEQSETKNEKLQAKFQLAYLEGDMAFLKKDSDAMLEALEMYEEPLQEYKGEYQEGPIRINRGVAYENVGRMTGDKAFIIEAKKEYLRAEEIFKRYENIEKTLKARTARFRIERQEWFEEAKKGGSRDVSRLIEMRDTLEGTLSLHPDRISGLQGWLSNEERLYIDLLWSAAIRDRKKYEQAKHELARMRDYFWEEVSKRGFDNNPWALSILLCREELQAEELWAQEQIGK